MRFITIIATILSLCVASKAFETSKNISTSQMMEKRHNECNDPCPPHMSRKGSCHCEYNTEQTIPCAVVCTEKPAIKLGGRFHDIPAHVCGKQTLQKYPIVAQDWIHTNPDPTKKEKQWDVSRCHYPGWESQDKVKFTGTMEEGGHLAMRIGEDGAIGRQYIVGLKVGFYTYFFNLPGYQTCIAEAPIFKEHYAGLQQLIVREVPSATSGSNIAQCPGSHS